MNRPDRTDEPTDDEIYGGIIERMIARRVKALIVETFAVRNGTPRTLLGEPDPRWILERAANAAQAICADEFIHVTSRVPGK